MPPIVLGEDDWASGPSPNWTVTRTPVAYDGTFGNPLGSMWIGAGGEVRSYAFGVPPLSTNLTISMDALFGGDGRIYIYDVDDPAAFPASPLAAVIRVGGVGDLYWIGAAIGSGSCPADLTFHTYTLVITEGSATWRCDGVDDFTAPFTKVSKYFIVVEGDIVTSTSSWVDNFMVTMP